MRLPRRLLLGACALAAAACLPAARAQDAGPPIRFIVPYAAAGLPDIVIRRISQRLGERLGGQAPIVENKPGGGGAIAAQTLLSSPADGKTFIFSDSAFISITPLMVKNVPYDPVKDFVPVSYVARAPNFLAVHAAVPANNLAEFVALAKQPGGVTCGSSGNGTLHHLTLETMKRTLGVDLVHVPYRGTGQSVPAMAGGQTQCVLAALPSLSSFAASGKAKILAIAGSRRSAMAADVPAMYEGRDEYDFAFLLGVVARPGTPQAAIDKLAAELAVVVKEPEIVAALNKIGVEPVGAGPKDYAEALRADARRLANAAKLANIQPE